MGSWGYTFDCIFSATAVLMAATVVQVLLTSVLTPRELLALARRQRVSMLAITDHDTVVGYLAALKELAARQLSILQAARCLAWCKS